MWSQLYRNHLIMPFPSYDTATSSWVPQADITWCTGGAREFEFVRFPKRVSSEAEAIRCALELGRNWIDDRLQRAGVAGQRQVIDMIGALKQGVGNAPAPGQRYSAWTRSA